MLQSVEFGIEKLRLPTKKNAKSGNQQLSKGGKSELGGTKRHTLRENGFLNTFWPYGRVYGTCTPGKSSWFYFLAFSGANN